MEPVPPGEETALGVISTGTDDAIICGTLSNYRGNAPIIGVEFIVEISRGGSREPLYYCSLCHKNFDSMGFLSEILNPEHRLKYLERFFPTCRKKFSKVMNMNYWERPTYDFLESVIQKIEMKYGRLKPTVCPSEQHFDKNKMDIIEKINKGPHFRECSLLNFETLPDPFGSYLYKIPNTELNLNFENLLSKKAHQTEINKGLDPISDPQIPHLINREINRFRTTQSGTSVQPVNATISQGPLLKNKDEDPEEIKKREHMAKLAAMKRELSSDEKIKEGYEKAKNNPDKIDEKSDNKSSDKSSDKSETIEQDDSKNQIADTDKISDEEFSITDDKPSTSEEESRKKPIIHRFKHRMEFDKNMGPIDHKRSRDRYNKLAKGRSKSPQNDREKDNRRDRRRSRSRERRRRSKSRSRDRDRRRSRSPPQRHQRRRRTPSPFTDHMERWDRFKSAKRVMLDAIDRKRDIYDKRPEDHPAYPEEWRCFWEKRYKELQAQGKDPDNHDFKADWIPYWTKKVNDLFEEEMADKTRSLLEKYNLPNEERPRRRTRTPPPINLMDDYERGPPPPPFHSMMDHPIDFNQRRSRSPYSGITDLEERRDRGFSPSRLDNNSGGQSAELIPVVRSLLALEEILGSLGQQVNTILSKALSLENKRMGLSGLLMQHCDVAAILEMVMEKLSAQIEADILDTRMIGAVRSTVNNLNRLLARMTRKRPTLAPSLVHDDEPNEKDKLIEMISELLSKSLVQQGLEIITNEALVEIINALVKKTELDDGIPFQVPDEWKQNKLPDPVNNYNYPSSSSYYDSCSAPPPPMPPPTEAASSSMPAYITPTYESGEAPIESRSSTKQPEVIELDDNNMDDLDDLTVDELRSLLDNFQNLSKAEQKDLIQYMRKLESTNPEKVKELRSVARAENQQSNLSNPSNYSQDFRDIDNVSNISGHSSNNYSDLYNQPPGSRRF